MYTTLGYALLYYTMGVLHVKDNVNVTGGAYGDKKNITKDNAWKFFAGAVTELKVAAGLISVGS